MSAGRAPERLSRRDFLAAAAGMAGGLGLLGGCAPAAGAPAAPSPGGRRVLVPSHLWVYASTQPDFDPTPVLDRVFADMKYAGMDGVELMERALRHPDVVERIGALSERHGLPVTGTSYGAPMWDRARQAEILEDAERVIGRLAALGGRTLGTTAERAPQRKTPEQLDAQAEVMLRMIAMCEARGVQLNVHNHTWEVADDLHELRGMLERVPELRLGPDLNWLVRGGVDPVWFIDTYADRIVYLHLRDQYADGRWSEAVGEGDTDFRAIGEALHRHGFSGYAAIELAFEQDFTPTRPIRESLRASREFVRETLGY
jgi:sugar phosphate isomerase/epimerase